MDGRQIQNVSGISIGFAADRFLGSLSIGARCKQLLLAMRIKWGKIPSGVGCVRCQVSGVRYELKLATRSTPDT